MLPSLTDNEARIIGCLMEKSVVTSNQYPLTLNALTNACNQKSARSPTMSLTQGEVQRVARTLADKSMVHLEENVKTGVEKYKQRLCNNVSSDFKFSPAQFAIVCLLLLRGAQTPGELRARSGRLHHFTDNQAVVDTLIELMSAGDNGDSLIVQLPQMPGRRDPEYMHQLCGVVDTVAYAKQSAAGRGDAGTSRARVAHLEARIRELEAENASLRAQLPAEE